MNQISINQRIHNHIEKYLTTKLKINKTIAVINLANLTKNNENYMYIEDPLNDNLIIEMEKDTLKTIRTITIENLFNEIVNKLKTEIKIN